LAGRFKRIFQLLLDISLLLPIIINTPFILNIHHSSSASAQCDLKGISIYLKEKHPQPHLLAGLLVTKVRLLAIMSPPLIIILAPMAGCLDLDPLDDSV
jgi:hypothetical protein